MGTTIAIPVLMFEGIADESDLASKSASTASPFTSSGHLGEAKELDYRLIKELWAFTGNRIAVRPMPSSA